MSPRRARAGRGDRRVRPAHPGVLRPAHRDRQLAQEPDLQHPVGRHAVPDGRAAGLDERPGRPGRHGRAHHRVVRRALRLGREDAVHHAVRRGPRPPLAGDRHHRLRRRRSTPPRVAADPARQRRSSTPSPTASSAATSCGSRCTPPSTPPTSRPSPPASTRSSSASDRAGGRGSPSADRRAMPVRSSPVEVRGRSRPSLETPQPSLALRPLPSVVDSWAATRSYVGLLEGDQPGLLDLRSGCRAGCRRRRRRRRPAASRRRPARPAGRPRCARRARRRPRARRSSTT